MFYILDTPLFFKYTKALDHQVVINKYTIISLL